MDETPDFSKMTLREVREYMKELRQESRKALREMLRQAQLEPIAVRAWMRMLEADMPYGRN